MIDNNKNSPQANYSAFVLGNLYLQQGKFDESITWFKEAESKSDKTGFVGADALEGLAACYEVTGSIGKTSTKEMLAHIVDVHGMNFLASEGNQNTALGISVNILKLRPEHQVAIFEMGISKRGEMARMADIVRPTSAVITSIGHSHMEGLGSLADIANEKRDIFKFFKKITSVLLMAINRF